MTEINFGLITEGISDQVLIEYILDGYFAEDEIIVNPLQPDRDKDTFGNWLNVFNYCKSQDFKEAFQFNDYIIVQIDTDVSEEKGFDIPKRDQNGDLTPEQLIENVKQKFQLNDEIAGITGN